MNSFEEVFAAVKDYCKERVTAPSYTVFFDKLEIGDFDGATAIIYTHAEFIRTSLNTRYLPLLREAFLAILGID